MKQVKENQQELVEYILENALCGPQNAVSLMGVKMIKSGISEAHVGFVMQQLLIVGALSQTSDTRYITTSAGEQLLKGITQHLVSKCKNKHNMLLQR